MKDLVCVKCEHIGKPKLIKKGSAGMEIFIWATVFVFGPFYSFWRWKDKKKVCEKCDGDVLVALDSRVGKLIAQKYGGIFEEEQEDDDTEDEFYKAVEDAVIDETPKPTEQENESIKLQEEVRRQELANRQKNSKIKHDSEDW